MRKYLLAAAAAAALSCIAAPAMAQCTGDNELTLNPDGTTTCDPNQEPDVVLYDDPHAVASYDQDTDEVSVSMTEAGEWRRSQAGDGTYQPSNLAGLRNDMNFYQNAVHYYTGTGIAFTAGTYAGSRVQNARVSGRVQGMGAAGGVLSMISAAVASGMLSVVEGLYWKEYADCRQFVERTMTISDDNDCG